MQHLSRFLVVLACTALVVIAEDFWVKKPYTDWTEKDAAKLLQNSPWTHEVSISAGAPAEGTGGGAGGRGRRGGGGGDMGNMGGSTPGGSASGGGDMSGGAGGAGGSGMGEAGGGGGGGGGGRGGRGGGGMGGDTGGGGAPTSILIRVRWQSALPVRQATVVTQLGKEKADSDQAKKFLAQELPGYLVGIVGLPGNMSQMPAERLNEMAKTSVSLQRKDKDPIAAESAIPSAKDKAVYFMFPKTSPITLDDKEVEFVAKVGRIEVKRKFKLKDMLVGDKLEL